MVFLLFIFITLPFSIFDYAKKTFGVNFFKRYIFLCCLIYFIIIAGGRYVPNTFDWDNYRGAFSLSGKIGEIRLSGLFEPGFELLLNIIKTFSSEYIVFFVTFEIIVCIFLYYNVKRYIGYPISACCLYFPIMFLPLDMAQIRSLLAVQLFIFSIQFIKDRKFIPFFLCIFSASMIHVSSIILFPMYFVLHKRFSNRIILVIIITGILINLLRIDFIIPLIRLLSPLTGSYINLRLTSYLFSGTTASRSIGFIHLEFLFFFPLFMVYRKKLINLDTYGNMFFNMYIMYGVTIFYLWRVSVFSGRLKFFFISSLIFLIPRLIRINKKIFLVAFLGYICYVLAMVFYVIYLQGGGSGFFDRYANYFFM